MGGKHCRPCAILRSSNRAGKYHRAFVSSAVAEVVSLILAGIPTILIVE